MFHSKKNAILFFVSLIGIVLVSLMLVTTYAYQSVQTDYKEDSNSNLGQSGEGLSSAILDVEYKVTCKEGTTCENNNYNRINLENMPILPDYKTADYTEFTVNNKGNAPIAYSISLIDLDYSEELISADFKYTIVKKDNDRYYILNEGDFLELSNNNFVLKNNYGSFHKYLNKEETETIRIYFWLKESDNDQQYKDVYFKAKLEITSLFTNELKEKVVSNFKIHGNSIQDSTPSTTTPMEIKNLGTLVTDVNDPNYNKYKISFATTNNIIDNNKVSNNMVLDGITGGITTNNSYATTDYIDVSGVDNISINLAGSFAFYDSDKNYISGENKSYTIFRNYVIPENAQFIRFTWNKSTVAENKVYAVLGDYTEDTLPAYNETINNIYLNEPLRKVGDCDTCSDYINIDNRQVVRNVKYMEFNTTDDWSVYASFAKHFQISVRDNYFSKDENYVMSNYYSADKIDGSYYSNSDYAVMSVDGSRIRFKNKDYTTLDEWTNYLNGLTTKLNVIYKLDTPKYENIDIPSINMNNSYTISVCSDNQVCSSNVELVY